MGTEFKVRGKARRASVHAAICMVLLLAVAGGSSGAMKAVWGQVYMSDHDAATGYNGTWAAIVVNHNGTNTTYEDPNGLDSSGYYSITLPDGDEGTKWAANDTFKVKVDGTAWSDANGTAHNATGGGSGHNYTDNTFVLDDGISQQQDVETMTTTEIPEFGLGPVVMMGLLVVVAALVSTRRRRRR